MVLIRLISGESFNKIQKLQGCNVGSASPSRRRDDRTSERLAWDAQQAFGNEPDRSRLGAEREVPKQPIRRFAAHNFRLTYPVVVDKALATEARGLRLECAQGRTAISRRQLIQHPFSLATGPNVAF